MWSTVDQHLDIAQSFTDNKRHHIQQVQGSLYPYG